MAMVFTRSSRHAVLSGVCGGLEEAGLGQAWLWRGIFVFLSCFWFIGIIAYILIAILTPRNEGTKLRAEVKYGISDSTTPAFSPKHEAEAFASANAQVAELPSGAVYLMKGVQETLVVYRDKVTITPEGVLGFLTKGVSGTKTIPFRSVTAIQFKEAGAVLSGFIQFTIPGGNERAGGVFSAASDENTFMFAGQQNNEMACRIKDFIDKAVEDYHSLARSAPTSAKSVSDEIQELARLKESGVLTDEEFRAAKGKLLG